MNIVEARGLGLRTRRGWVYRDVDLTAASGELHAVTDARTVSDYQGQRGEHYYVTETYTVTVDGRQETRTRQVRHTRWHPAAGTVRRDFDDVLVPATTHLPTEQLDKLAPWPLAEVTAFHGDYLAGYQALRYDTEPEAGLTEGGGDVIVLATLVALDQWRGADSIVARLDAARPTVDVPEIAALRNALQPSDRVVCTDELGCLLLIDRIDRWLALDDFVRERFLVRRGDAPVSGVYTGVPAAFRPADLFAPTADGSFPDRIVIVDIFKDYPIGNSRSWLPRAIEEDGVQVILLLETPQMRAVEIVLPERAATLVPP